MLFKVANIIAKFRSSDTSFMLTDGRHLQQYLREGYTELVLKSNDTLLFRLIIFSSFGSNLIPKPRTRSQNGVKTRQACIKNVNA